MIPVELVYLAGELFAVVLVGGCLCGFYLTISLLAADFMETL
jgi:hypothetical protein